MPGTIEVTHTHAFVRPSLAKNPQPRESSWYQKSTWYDTWYSTWYYRTGSEEDDDDDDE